MQIDLVPYLTIGMATIRSGLRLPSVLSDALGSRAEDGVAEKLLMRPAEPPMQVQLSSQPVESSQERSAGNIRSGSAKFQACSLHVVACWGPA
jgi:hypothetical protein